MFLEEFIFRFLRLEAHPLFLLAKSDDVISFRVCSHSMTVLTDLVDLLNTLLSEEDGAFVLSFNMINKCLDLKFVDAEC